MIYSSFSIYQGKCEIFRGRNASNYSKPSLSLTFSVRCVEIILYTFYILAIVCAWYILHSTVIRQKRKFWKRSNAFNYSKPSLSLTFSVRYVEIIIYTFYILAIVCAWFILHSTVIRQNASSEKGVMHSTIVNHLCH